MRAGQILLLAALAVVILPRPAAQPSDVETRREKLKAALQEEWDHQLKAHPELATRVGDDRFNDRLSDYSADFYLAEVQHATQFLSQLDAIDSSGFPEQEKLNKILAVRSVRDLIEELKFRNWEVPVSQFGGGHLEYPSLVSETPFRSVKDYENYIARLHQLPRVFEQITTNMRLGMRDRLMPPKSRWKKWSHRRRALRTIRSKPFQPAGFQTSKRNFSSGSKAAARCDQPDA